MSEEKVTEAQESGEALAEDAAEAQTDQVSDVDWQKEAEHWKAQAEENQNRMMRALADMENLRRRVRKEQEDLAKYASLRVIEELLPVLDNFERAMAADKESMTVDSLLQGVNMVYRQMVQVFEKEGLTPIQAAGQPFDPNIHQAVMQVEDPGYESGVVVEELQKGYQFKDRVVRPAMVKVNA
ncbi:nucleotide exchange factor GrpE [Brevibacillus sp. H7]|uniref:nucleotide exchange factor GrpE n=1 Tax=Brevibacillus sp. H7 TaxID=3349138 RepID=UPI00382E1EDA